MKMDPQNRLYSRDQVKTATLVIFFTFLLNFNFFTKKLDVHKNHFAKTEKTENHAKYTFATPGSARRGAISQFSSNYDEIHQIPPTTGEFLLISRFQVNSTHFRPKAVTLTWSREIIEYFLPYWRNYHVFSGIPPLLVNSSIIHESW